MSAPSSIILAHLGTVVAERQRRVADPALGERVRALKAYQQQRFARTHADLLATAHYAAAARFFLDDLYGPQDFSERDAQFARIVPALVRLFPAEIVTTVAALAAVHALSEQLDSAMGQHGAGQPPLSRAGYVKAWQATGQPDARRQQLALVLQVGRQLDLYTRKRLLRQSLRLMRGPAQAAGLGALQSFLEQGFDVFAAMGGADHFLAKVAEREAALITRLFEPDAVAVATCGEPSVTDAIGQLP
jgi:hypothetical protein